MIWIMICLAFDATQAGQRGLWDKEQKVTKFQHKKPLLKLLDDTIPWIPLSLFLDQGYA